MRNRSSIVPGLAVAALGVLVFAAADTRAEELLRLDGFDSGEDLRQEAFVLRRAATLQVDCEGAGGGGREEMYAYGWILDARTREVVWALSPERSRAKDGERMTFSGTVSLPAGAYVAGFAAYGAWRGSQKIVRIMGREIIRFEIDSGKKHRMLREAKRWHLVLTAPGDLGSDDFGAAPEEEPDARVVVQLIGMGDDAAAKRGFTLRERTRLTVYALGEWDEGDGALADQAWILDARTRAAVWALAPGNFRHAGGAAKNKMARETISLPPSDYVVFYTCDGSHSADGWNAPPPYDPEYWGVTLWAESGAAARRIAPYEDAGPEHAMVALVRQPSDAYAQQGFKLGRPTQLRVYALGEYTTATGFVDRGWIEQWGTGKRVWEMTPSNTRTAGGAAKNRLADEMVALAAGDYVLQYRSDDSHAYDDWNAPPPFDPESWGIALYPAGRDAPPPVQLFDAEARAESGRESLVRLVRLGDNADVSRTFRLERPTRVRIVAVGEGVEPEMVDYGWIEATATGSAVWELTWRNSRHAGGARKNRIFNGTLLLDRGEYVAHFVTDGSHSYTDWNDQPPDEPASWGITITVESATP